MSLPLLASQGNLICEGQNVTKQTLYNKCAHAVDPTVPCGQFVLVSNGTLRATGILVSNGVFAELLLLSAKLPPLVRLGSTKLPPFVRLISAKPPPLVRLVGAKLLVRQNHPHAPNTLVRLISAKPPKKNLPTQFPAGFPNGRNGYINPLPPPPKPPLARFAQHRVQPPQQDSCGGHRQPCVCTALHNPWLHDSCHLGGLQRSERGDKIRTGPQEGGMAT